LPSKQIKEELIKNIVVFKTLLRKNNDNTKAIIKIAGLNKNSGLF
jgi:hypothetical protein